MKSATANDYRLFLYSSLLARWIPVRCWGVCEQDPKETNAKFRNQYACPLARCMTHHLAAGYPCRTALNSGQGRPRLHGSLAGGPHLPVLARRPVAYPVTILGGCQDAWCTRSVILSDMLNLGWELLGPAAHASSSSCTSKLRSRNQSGDDRMAEPDRKKRRRMHSSRADCST